ncbi:MAG: transposase [Alphaproteobacteria bacterium]|nr:transposase [Alphaproteobacteria bacterium]
MFRILVIQNQNNPSDDRTEFLINDRLSFIRFPDLGLGSQMLGPRSGCFGST